MANLDVGALQTGAGASVGPLQPPGALTIIPEEGSPLVGGSIPSGESWGSPKVAGPIKLSSAIASGESWGSPSIANPKEIFPATIPTGVVWFTPSVTGPVNPGIIPSGESWGAPLLKQSQTIALEYGSPLISHAIGTAEAWYAPAIRENTQTIIPEHGSPLVSGSIPSAESWGSPVVRGGPKYIVTTPIASAERWYPPVITGGATGVQIFMSGVEVKDYLWLEDNYFKIQSQTLGRWQTTFTLVVADGSFTPVIGQTLLIMDVDGSRVLAGCVLQVQQDRQLSTAQLNYFHITGTDKSSICDHRVVTGKTYLVADGWDYADIYRDICNLFLNGEGISPAGVPQSLGIIGADLNWNFPSVTNAYDQVARDSGTVWWIDVYSVLQAHPLISLPPAPISITETSENWRASTTGSGQSPNPGMLVTTTTQNYYNKLYCVTNLNVLPASANGMGGGYTETFDCTVNTSTGAHNPGVIVDQDGSGNFFPAGVFVSTAIGSVSGITINGVPVAADHIIDYNAYAGQPTAGLWVYVQGNLGVNPYFIGPGQITNGVTIVVTYVPYQQNQGVSVAQYGDALAPLDPHGAPLGTCGSGVYEGVIQVQSINDQASLNAVAAAELARIGGVPTTVDFQTDFPGLRPGQLLSVNVPNSGADNLMVMITSVTGTYIPLMNDETLGHGSAFS
jgi:hypothetical protein